MASDEERYPEEEEEIVTEMDLDLTDVEGDKVADPGALKPGRYHAFIEVISVKHKINHNISIMFSFIVMDGEHRGYRGKRLVHYLTVSQNQKTRERVGTWAYRLGLLKKEEVGKSLRINWAPAFDKHVVIEVILKDSETDDGKPYKRPEVSWVGIWPVEDDRVQDVPMDRNAPGFPVYVSKAPTAPAKGAKGKGGAKPLKGQAALPMQSENGPAADEFPDI